MSSSARFLAMGTKTMKEELFDTGMGKKLYTNLAALQRDLDVWLSYYHGEGRHSGKYC